jgi:lysylphosphatidylglycerol synthetase-like protein (DUF2156 family)
VAVLGASDEWLPVYASLGMRHLYLGDEGIVDCTSLNLDGGKHKSLRQAVNRVAKYGYRCEMLDPATLDPQRQPELLALLAESRQGTVERGFSMTLGRIFDPADEGLLLAVCYGPDGAPAALCQYVPAPAIDGYSLDLMRRSKAEHPNGLIDFLIVSTIRHLQAEGHHGLGLNFATMRAVLADEVDGGRSLQLQRWLVERMSETMQIESLWRFNQKFGASWRPRFGVYDCREHLPSVAIAVARAEGATELPVVGRFLKPRTPNREPVPAAR